MKPYEDYNLVRDVQSNDRDAAMRLYDKFKRLIRKKAYCTSTPEDFMQDSYETMLKAAFKVRLADVKDPERWGFCLYLTWFLNVKVKKQILREKRHNEGLWHNSFEGINEGVFEDRHPGCLLEEKGSEVDKEASPYDHRKRHKAEGSNRGWGWWNIPATLVPSEVYHRYSPANEAFRSNAEETYRRFMARCTEEQRALLLAKQDGRSIREGAESLKIPYAKARTVVMRARERAVAEIVEGRLEDRSYRYGTVKRGSLLEASLQRPKIDEKISSGQRTGSPR